MATRAEKIEQFNVKQTQKESRQPNLTELVKGKELPEITTEQAIQGKAQETKQARTQQKQQAQEQAEEDKQQAQQTQHALKQATTVVSEAGKPISDKVDTAKKWLTSIPTPGGILTILLVIALIVLAISPIDSTGMTRLKLMWLTLTGKTQLDYTSNPQYGGGAGGTFSGKGGDISQGPPSDNSSNGSIQYDVPNEISLTAFLFGEE